MATLRICTHMANPRVKDYEKLKRVARYLKHRPRALYVYRWQSSGAKVWIYSDSDWAGDRVTRRSVAGGAIYHGEHLIKTYAKAQVVVATSSAEAELYAFNKAAA